MSKQKPGIPKGTRDFGPEEVAKRNYIIDIIRHTYALYGYQPLETPVMENLSTLMGKYGEEGDKLLFKILNSGDFLKDADAQLLADKQSNKVLTSLSEKGLRYDLTVPFARYVVMHQNEITFPFKRYQIQPVWRADRPQKGRYREFYQCDADVIGSNSLLNEVELIQIIDNVFTKLNLDVTIKLNNRKLLSGIALAVGHPDKMTTIATAIDKYDKIGQEGVKTELLAHGFVNEEIQQIFELILINEDRVLYGGIAETNHELLKLHILKGNAILENNNEINMGINELDFIIRQSLKLNINSKIEIDFSLARGLNYYTGTIFEVVSNDVQMGSILGGGRYDDLTGIFGLPNMSGVGISFGLDRIYDVLTELNRFPASASMHTQVLFVAFDADAESAALQYARQLREMDIRCELYPDLSAKTPKKFKYADDKQIPYCAIIGSNELAEQKVMLKNMQSGEQELLSIEEVIQQLTGRSGFVDLSE